MSKCVIVIVKINFVCVSIHMQVLVNVFEKI